MEKMKIAITGGNSFIGNHLVKFLTSHKFRINSLSRTELNSFENESVNYFKGNILKKETLYPFIEGCDVVVNLAYIGSHDLCENINAMDNLASVCCDLAVKRFIHCSTSSVYGINDEAVIDENTPCNPQSKYAKTKYAIEGHLIDNYRNYLEIAILRPTEVFGPGGKNLIKLIKGLSNGPRLKNYLKSCLMANRNMNLVFVNNLVNSILHLIKILEMKNTIYLVSDSVCKYSEIEDFLMEKMNIKPFLPRFPLPVCLYKHLHLLAGKGYVHAIRKYQGKNLLMEGFINNFDLETSLEIFTQWYKNRDEML